jgi:alpha-L-arabinofuranosidase
LDIAATRDTRGKTIVLHIANTSDKQQDITTNLTYRSVKVWSISSQPDDDNTPENPRKITPQAQHQEKGKPISIYPYSYTVVELKL